MVSIAKEKFIFFPTANNVMVEAEWEGFETKNNLDLDFLYTKKYYVNWRLQ